jgi:hypothetical protein
MDVRRGGDRVRALADDADHGSLLDGGAAQHARRAELQQGHGVAVGGLDRDRPAAVRNRADERDGPGSRCEHRASQLARDVDASMLPAGVGVRAERERTQDRPRGGPDPGMRRRRDGERRCQDQDREEPPHD